MGLNSQKNNGAINGHKLLKSGADYCTYKYGTRE